MAVTKIKAIRGTLSKALAYISNPDKTEDKLLISTYGCASETAAQEFEWTRRIAEQKGMKPVRIIARHVIQSFDVGEVTPELAHEIGKQFADEILGGKYEYVLTTHTDKNHVHNHLIFNAVDFVDHHAYKSYKKIYYDMREVSDRLCKENGLSVIPPSQNKGMGYKEYTEAKRGTSWKQKLKQTIDRFVIVAKDYDEFLKLMQEAGYEIKTGKYISFRAEGQERFTRSKTIGENYTEERIRERIQGRNPRKLQRQSDRSSISLISRIQERITEVGSKGYEHKAKITILKEAARTLDYLTENNLLQYADLEKKVEDVHSSYARTGEDLKAVEARLRTLQPLIKNIGNYQKLKPVWDAYMKAKDKPTFRAKHEAELVIFEAAKSTLLAMHGDEKLPSLKSLQSEQQRLLDEQQRLLDEQQRLYDERSKLKAKTIDTMKANVDAFLKPTPYPEHSKEKNNQLE